MIPTVRIRRSVVGALAVGAACAALGVPAASADPDDTPAPAPATDDCNAATLASTIGSVTSELSTYFAAHPDANQALIDATRQPAFIAVGQFEAYTDAHPDQADAIRAINAPLTAFKDRCGMQVSPTDALTVLADL
jgi:heme-binding protein